MNTIDPGEVRTLVVRAPNWLGDSVMALPALKALRAGVPQGQITLVGPWAGLFADQGVADRVVAYPRSFARRLSLTRALRSVRADTALILPNSLESALAAWSWGAARRVGFATDGRARLLTHSLPHPAPRRHQVDEYIELLKAFELDASENTPRWILGAGPEDAEVSRLFRDLGAGPSDRLVGLHLGAAFGTSKLWPVERWASLGSELGRRGFVPVLLGSGADLGVAADVLRHAPMPVASLVARDRPALLPCLLSRLEVLVAGDTGVAQLAAAVGAGVVVLFGPTDPRLTAPRGARVIVLAKDVKCAPCFLPVCPIDHPCMRGIGVGEVAAAVVVLSGTRA
ncbi:MAG: glycosyltransferase family 9 protein [Candidatus Rokubacteria bacterium]|nr:glycosyltransferase family 9 protein [Candidatus Rokubacteria bacterium]